MVASYVFLVVASALAIAPAQGYADVDGYGEAGDGFYGSSGGSPLSSKGGADDSALFVGSRGPTATDCDCPSDVLYVCGSDGNTYNNACMAQCAGIVPVFQGVCYNGCMCFAVDQLLCLVPEQTSFLNYCLADCAIDERNPIIDFSALGTCTGACVDCPRDRVTVCDVSEEGAGNEYVNSCYAECSGVTEWQTGICDVVFGLLDEDCGCSSEDPYAGEYDFDTPVCSFDGSTLDSACVANCGTSGVAYTGPCETSCGSCGEQGGPEVCGTDGITYMNACEARCVPIGVVAEGACKEADGCGCSAEVLEPVCATTGGTFMNECFLDCAGQVMEAQGPCEYDSDYVDGPFDGYGNPIEVVDGVVVVTSSE